MGPASGLSDGGSEICQTAQRACQEDWAWQETRRETQGPEAGGQLNSNKRPDKTAQTSPGYDGSRPQARHILLCRTQARSDPHSPTNPQEQSPRRCCPMSASGYKRTYSGQLANVRFTPESGRNWVFGITSAFDPKRTLRMLDAVRRLRVLARASGP